jgi:serine/threonine-protein kinase
MTRLVRVRGSVCAAVLMMAPAVRAQSAQAKAEAEALFNAGRAALQAGNFADACPKLAESQKRDPAIGTSLYLAECYERSGKVASAWAEFRQAEDMAKQRGDNRATLAKARAERLSPSKIVVALAPGADIPGLEVKRDGEVMASAVFGVPFPIDGGKHNVVATAPDHARYEWNGEIPAQQGSVTVTIPKLESASAPVATSPAVVPTTETTAPPVVTPPVVEHRGGGLGAGKIAGLVIAGVGLVAVGVGTTIGLIANANYQATSTGTDMCTSMGCPNNQGVNDRNAAKGLADASTGLFIGGAVAAVGGLVMFLVIPKPKATSAELTLVPLVGSQLGGAMLTGRF